MDRRNLIGSLKARLPGTGRMRRDLFVLGILVSAVALLIWNGTTFFGELAQASGFTGAIRLSSTTLTLNVALILFGWRYYVDLQHEIQRRAESEERAAIIAKTDGMTGLLNRRGFSEAGKRMVEQARTQGRDLAIVSVQLNRFKAVNDRHGFDVGDEVLRQIARRLEDIVGEQRALARVSGDEFAVIALIGRGKREACEHLAKAMLEAVTAPILVNQMLVNVGAFIGMASADSEEIGVRGLLRRADIAQSHGRQGRVGRPIWFDSAMERELMAHSEVEQGIRAGIGHGQFMPFFEPQVDLSTGKIVGFEVLARWNHPISGMVMPDRFIPIAEENGLIDQLSEEIFVAALLAAREWPHDIRISINVSPTQLADSWLAQKLVRMLTETGFPAERLMVEITESSLFSDLELARAIVSSLKNQGIRLALDDFGTGFSSLSHLRSLPFDSIKIDRSFVKAVHQDREAEAIIRAVSTLAEAIKVPVTVEGIENAETHETVLGLGCDLGQGWYFGKPMSAHHAEQLLRGDAALDLVEPAARKSAQG
ncbi:putative bifunctional diguanylate cyclase/phosphodiesterase [Sphingomicrobium flavum]|uniref:putative bifunctional diguanylate cyclase/phosphodiesterase n=1 Tax=Sphingomicrobium flavum TaxID=1229164 RepID=UPI0021ADD36C|nr:EAL domain-containing protein [Sphingomicrobium flavum]